MRIIYEADLIFYLGIVSLDSISLTISDGANANVAVNSVITFEYVLTFDIKGEGYQHLKLK